MLYRLLRVCSSASESDWIAAAMRKFPPSFTWKKANNPCRLAKRFSSRQQESTGFNGRCVLRIPNHIGSTGIFSEIMNSQCSLLQQGHLLSSVPMGHHLRSHYLNLFSALLLRLLLLLVVVVCCLLFVVCCLLFVVCCLLFVVCFVVCCLLFVVCCLFCCLLFVVCCLLFVVSC